MTCIFVASKIEETIKKLKDIFVAVHSVKYPDSKELDPENVNTTIFLRLCFNPYIDIGGT